METSIGSLECVDVLGVPAKEAPHDDGSTEADALNGVEPGVRLAAGMEPRRGGDGDLVRLVLGAVLVLPRRAHDALRASRPQIALKPIGDMDDCPIVRRDARADVASADVVLSEQDLVT